MKSKDLFLKDIKELNIELTNLLREKFNMHIGNSSNKIQKTHLFKKTRRNIARIKTVLFIKKIKEVTKK